MTEDKTDKDEPQNDASDDESSDDSSPIEADISEVEEDLEEAPETDGEESEAERAKDVPKNGRSERTPFQKLDDAVYKLETVVVVTALIAMSVFVFTDVAYQLAVTMSQQLSAANGVAMAQLGAILGFIGLMAFAATAREEEEEGETPPVAKRVGVAVATVVGTFVVGYALLHLESATVYRVVLVALAIPAAIVLRDDKPKLVVFAISVAISFWIFGRLPSGFSWAQSYSLVLLLWVGFLGASIAARERRHLRVDLMRKLCPPKFLAHFNAVSYLVAAIFTGIVFYLGYIYMFGPDSSYLRPIWDVPGWIPVGLREQLLNEFPVPADASFFRRALQVLFAPSEPGELPDWLKAAAIPVSMLLIGSRFLGHSLSFARMAFRGEVFEENVAGSH